MTKRILVVDDEQDIREIVQLCLEDVAEWQAIGAESGAEALQQLQMEKVDAILLDISMPEMDGAQLVEIFQADQQISSIPVILLTAKVLPSDQLQFAEMSIAGVITKPFDPATIGAQVAEILGWYV
jgi:CheY-like chemotaxis protein